MQEPAPTFQALLPTGIHALDSVDPLTDIPAEHRPATQTAPWVFTNMITSLDGATSLGGVSGPLGGAADSVMFRAMRSAADAILVGARTATEEKYRPAKPNGAGEKPPIIIITSRLDLPIDLPVFQDPSIRPILATVASADPSLRKQFSAVADVQTHGDILVDLPGLLRSLRSQGYKRLLLEGGPTLNGHFIAQDLVDEWNLTISPLLASGGSSRPSRGPEPARPTQLELRRLWSADETLFGRWVRPDLPSQSD